MKNIFNSLFIILGCFFFVFCSNSNKTNTKLEKNILGNWQSENVKWADGTISFVPDNEKQIIELSTIQKKNSFNVGNVSGNWSIKDSILILENIPECTTYIDSIFVVNDSYGNSSIVLKNGNLKIATLTNKGVEPEKVISQMRIVSLLQNHLHLAIGEDVYIYKKINH